jgi:hypothetical protein
MSHYFLTPAIRWYHFYQGLGLYVIVSVVSMLEMLDIEPLFPLLQRDVLGFVICISRIRSQPGAYTRSVILDELDEAWEDEEKFCEKQA